MKINYKFLLKNVPCFKFSNFDKKIKNMNENEALNMNILNECNDSLYRDYEKYLNEQEINLEESEEKKNLSHKKKNAFKIFFPKLSNNYNKNDNDNKKEIKIKNIKKIKNKINEELYEKNIFHNPENNNKYSIYSNYKKPLSNTEKENNLTSNNNINNTDSNLINSTTINSNIKQKKKTLKLSLKEFIENDKINKENLYSTNNNYFNKINKLCTKIKNKCSDNLDTIKNRPKFHFVSQSEIQSNINKVALGVKPGYNDAINAFQNMRIFRETNAMTKISFDLSYNANKFIKKLLIKDNKKNKKYISYNQIEKSKEKRSKMFNTAFNILSKSEGKKKDCIKTVDKQINQDS